MLTKSTYKKSLQLARSILQPAVKDGKGEFIIADTVLSALYDQAEQLFAGKVGFVGLIESPSDTKTL
jgi:hypothetical protein